MTPPPVITGIGVVSAAGAGLGAARAAAREGRIPAAARPPFDVSAFGIDRAAFVDEACLESIQGSRQVRRMSRVSQFALAAAVEALADAGEALDGHTVHDTAGVVAASTYLSTQYGLDFTDGFLREGKPTPGPIFFSNGCLNAVSSHISMEYRLTGCNRTIVGGMDAGIHALGVASRLLGNGPCTMIICVASEEISEVLVGGYAKLRLTPPMIPGEGSAALILETEERARARGATPYARVLRFASAHGPDIRHDPEGRGIGRAIESVCSPSDAPLYSSCANGTDLDEIESRALQTVFARPVERLAPKPALGEGYSFTSLAQAALLAAEMRDRDVPAGVACSFDRLGSVSAISLGSAK
ncbi:MAG: beta-ketoacyl synthase N-terminal-like domain-containing protein [Planctomycetota bacterium]|jgi:3-oxoacyl-[acyl-carrier-protein] synthase II